MVWEKSAGKKSVTSSYDMPLSAIEKKQSFQNKEKQSPRKLVKTSQELKAFPTSVSNTYIIDDQIQEESFSGSSDTPAYNEETNLGKSKNIFSESMQQYLTQTEQVSSVDISAK